MFTCVGMLASSLYCIYIYIRVVHAISHRLTGRTLSLKVIMNEYMYISYKQKFFMFFAVAGSSWEQDNIILITPTLG